MTSLGVRRMKMNWTAALLVLLITTPAFGDYPECPDNTEAATITEWRDGLVKQLTDDSSWSAESNAAEAMFKCFPTREQTPKCLRRASVYLSKERLGSSSNDTSFEDTPQRQPPKVLLRENAEGFEYFVPPNIEEIAEQNGWIPAKYKSRHAGGFDSETASLLVVYVPGDKVDPPVNYDRWLNFALPADTAENAMKPLPQRGIPTKEDYENEANGGEAMPRTFTMVSLERPKDGKPAQVYFQKFGRSGYGNGIWMPSGNSGVTGCYGCHPNGLRAFSPLGYHVRAGEPQLPEKTWNNIKKLNDAMDEAAEFETVSWRTEGNDGNGKPFLVPEAYWPIVGASSPLNKESRTKKFILGEEQEDGSFSGGCATSDTYISLTDIFGRPPGAKNIYKMSENPSIRWETVVEAMDCESCHDGYMRGTINEGTTRAQWKYKILVDQSMPDGYHQNPLDQGGPNVAVKDSLTPDERMALVNCLDAEMDLEEKLLDEYLTKQSCE